MTSSEVLSIPSFLDKYKGRVELEIENSIAGFGPKTVLRDACEYSLLNGGKRLRPIIVMMIAEALGKERNVVDAALAVEFFHTASLIADDLPCMDDDDMRRGRPSLHKVHGEAVALLASYALIAAGYRSIHDNAQSLEENKVCLLALENATFNTGISGATGGQFLDIYPPDNSLSTLKRVIHRKTVTLFEIAFVFGWLFGGGDLEKIEKVKRAAWHFGMAFQIADDFGDVEQDITNDCQTNVVNAIGRKAATSFFEEEINAFQKLLVELELLSQDFTALINKVSSAVFSKEN